MFIIHVFTEVRLSKRIANSMKEDCYFQNFTGCLCSYRENFAGKIKKQTSKQNNKTPVSLKVLHSRLKNCHQERTVKPTLNDEVFVG